MDTLDIADEGERLDGADLQESIDALEAMAKSIDADIVTATDVDAVQALGAAQAGLRERAQALIDAQIDLAAGDLRITADHINAAATYARDAVVKIDDVRKKVETATKVVEFFGVVMTGDGTAILNAAVKLKDVL